ncbi:class II glutamine amidotransferase [Bradyrhizobium brasilense]|uniref:Glutamine amidotransferase family protein n=1 Tax=Bradyrhizobium brasilense TaxID=1419277 RepID=A0ABY8JAY2_9BRAD|nr:glutamine amidotransferase family protein [Bradyrhizobium brasilense]WFU62724.1 glutamine amidotransferase family protein [Bradyrhizobium brasilense]
MCGIAGLFIKRTRLQPRLGELLASMTSTLCSRGPDSAGFALYTAGEPGRAKLTLTSVEERSDFEALGEMLSRAVSAPVSVVGRYTHAVVTVPADLVNLCRNWLLENAQDIRILSEGGHLEIYKEVGYPDDIARSFGIASLGGTHGIAHTRMATESAVTATGAHPFSTGPDQCLVHNGSLSNHASVRRELGRDGIVPQTENDTEVAAGYLTRELKRGRSLGEALKSSVEDLDGFFTFVVGTKNGFGVLRDPIACKPAVMAETDDYVAFASEYRSLTPLPGIKSAKLFEPKPATPYFWEH